MVIGVALAAIALGCWAGGRAADLMLPRWAPGSVAGGVRGGGGTPFAVRAAGAFDRGALLMLVSMFAIIVPGTFLAAYADGYQAAPDQPQRDRYGRRRLLGDRHRRGHRRHRRHRLRSHHGRRSASSWSGSEPRCPRRAVEFRVRRPAVGGRSGGACAPRWRCRRDRTQWLRRGDDLPLPRPGRARPQRAFGRVDARWRTAFLRRPRGPDHLDWDYAKAVASVIDTAYPEGQPLRVYHYWRRRADLAALPLVGGVLGRRAWCPKSIPALSRSTASSSDSRAPTVLTCAWKTLGSVWR